jgi:hypothetical protein
MMIRQQCARLSEAPDGKNGAHVHCHVLFPPNPLYHMHARISPFCKYLTFARV